MTHKSFRKLTLNPPTLTPQNFKVFAPLPMEHQHGFRSGLTNTPVGAQESHNHHEMADELVERHEHHLDSSGGHSKSLTRSDPRHGRNVTTHDEHALKRSGTSIFRPWHEASD